MFKYIEVIIFVYYTYYLVSYLLLHLCHMSHVMLVVSLTMTPPSPLLLLSSLTLVTSDWCPEAPGWLLVGNSCYLVSVQKLSWHRAQEFCWGRAPVTERGGAA